MFLQCLEAAIQVPKALPVSKQLRTRFIALLHRLVECVLGGVLPYLPAALEVLLQGCGDARDTTEVLALLTQLMTRFKEGLGKLLDAVLPVVVERVHGLLGQDWDWSGKAASPSAMAAAGSAAQQQQQQREQQQQQQQREQQQQQQQAHAGAAVAATLEEAREKGELQRAYYSLLHGMALNGLAGSLLQAPPAVLDAVMTAISKGAASHVDASVRRMCLQVGVVLGVSEGGVRVANQGDRCWVTVRKLCMASRFFLSP